MTITSRIRPILGYRTLPTTTLLVLIYIIALTSIFVSDQLASIPHQGSKKLKWLNLDLARRDLEHIAARPHPYNSHANDAVRDYIHSRLKDMADGRDYVHIDNDLKSNTSWASPTFSVYFEGTNLLVKIDGTGDSDEAVLFSAHYDSVSTAPGATDDGMGVTTLLQLIEYFASNRTEKTAIFNINNGEEDWLNGAHAFWQHPWSNLTTTFVNLEGAAAGGRPMLFRSTSLQPIQGYYTAPRTARVRSPHGNVLSSDAFARGVIRSGTDFSVYAGSDRHGPNFENAPVRMEGLDIAFYKGRSRYHTKWDSPSFTDGGELSLWAMIEVARGVGSGLLSQKPQTKESPSRAGVYFDLFKSVMVSFRLKSLLTFNVVALVVGPIVLALLYVLAAVIGAGDTPPPVPPKRPAQQSGHGASASNRPPARTFGSSDGEDGASFWSKLRTRSFLIRIWQHSSFWVALVVTTVVQGLLVWGYVALNPFIIYTHPYSVLLSAFTLAYLTVVLTLKLAFPSSPIKHATISREKEKTTILLHVHFLAWVALLFATVLIAKARVGGVYVITAWYIGVWGASVVGILQRFTSGNDPAVKGKRRAPRRSGSGSSSSDSDDDRHHGQHRGDERTPLLASSTAASNGHAGKKDGDEGGAIGWWIVQVLLSVPLFLALLGQIALMLLDSMSQTLTDGSSAATVYVATAFIAVFLIIPIAPYSPKLHQGLTYLAITVFAITTTYLWVVFPFTHDDPFKVFFQQRVKLNPDTVFLHSNTNTTTSLSAPKVTTLLTASPVFLHSVIPYLPSSRGKDLNCTQDVRRAGLLTCEWDSGARLVPSPGGKDPWGWWPGSSSSSTWLKADVTRTSWASAKITIQGRNTRNCRLYFDSPEQSGVKVVRYTVEGGSRGMQPGYPVDQEHGATEVRLWSRTWDRTFVVDVDWEPTRLARGDNGEEEDGTLSGKIACEWAEYESGMVDNGSFRGEEKAKIPAFEEVLTFLPEWAAVTKAADGLVEAWVPFSV
ncbi:hypothetical protein D9611_003592 [Ephemerocybe angulata]|uniref:Peptide hydrolase n=1 Tax=Ephemerocybe angulata TaxID=980116 RepID=A0A8H5EYI2_9AGAR|nr:hypothetical protein D9611_003592 [Tulosesus angulatus]